MIPGIDEAERHANLILVAEDHPADREVISMQLNSLGYAFIIVNNGREAFKEWQGRPFGLILSDCQMPVIDGLKLAGLIRTDERERPELNRTPIVAITENELTREADHCCAAGMDEILCKPVEIEKLKRVIDKCMGSLHRDRNLRTEPAAICASAQHIFEKVEDRQIIDFDRFSELIGSDDKKIHKSLLTIYWRTALEDFILINNAIIRKDRRELKDRIHSAKGATDYAGAVRLSKFFVRLQKEAENDEWIKLFKSIQIYGKELRNIEQLLIRHNIISP